MARCAPPELLMAYAAGNTPEAVSLVLATHLALCPACRASVAGFEAVGGALLAGLEAAPVAESLLDRALSRLDEPEEAAPPTIPGPDWMPEPLRSYVGELRWRLVAPRVWVQELPVRLGREPVRLARMKPGMRVPAHSHRGIELQLVLQGGFTADGQDYRRGDLQIADDAVTHELSIDAGEDCVTLLVKENPLVQTTWRGHLAGWVTGI